MRQNVTLSPNIIVIRNNYVLFQARFESRTSKKLISSLIEIEKSSADYMTSFSDRRSLLSKTNKLAKNDKILIRDKAIIEQEIQNFDKRLYDDLTCRKYDYGYLRRLVAGRKKAKADWHQTLTR